MKNKLILLRDPLLLGSIILFIGNSIGNFANYLYHLSMGRILGPADYSILESLISVIYLMMIPIGTISLVIVKYVSQFKGENRPGAIGKFYQKLNSDFFKYSIIVFLAFLIVSPLINSFLRLSSVFDLVIVDLIFLASIFLGINRAFLQGLASFLPLSLSSVVESFGKLLFAVILVAIGLKVTGAVAAILIACLVSLFLCRYLLKNKVKIVDHANVLGKKEILAFAGPAFIVSMSMTSLYTTDIILVRHFLPAYEAGLYSALAVLGKIIFFVSSPITAVMFPLVSERHANNGKYSHVFWQSFCIVLLFCLVFSLSYFVFPKTFLGILYGERYLLAASFLGLFAVFLSLYSLSNILINFFLSIKKQNAAILPLIAAVFQIVLIFFFHEDIKEIVSISIIVNGLLLISLMLYYWKNERK